MYINVFVIPLIIVLVVNGFIFRHIYNQKKSKGTFYFINLVIATTVYTFFYALEISTTSLNTALIFYKLEYLGIPFISVFFLLFTLDFTGRASRISESVINLVYAIPLITIIIVVSNEFHSLYLQNPHLQESVFYTFLSFQPGPWYWVHGVYSTTLIIFALILLINMWLNSAPLFRKQVAVIIYGGIIPYVIYTLYLIDIFPKGLDPSPYAFFLTVIIIYTGFIRYKVFSIVPLGRSMIFDNVPNPVIIVDLDNHIVDRNTSSQKSLGISPRDIGKTLNEVLPDWPELTTLKPEFCTFESEKLIKGSVFYFRLTTNPILNKETYPVGLILLFQDITEEKKQEEKNEKLLKDLTVSEEKYRDISDRLKAILKSMPDLLFVLDKDGNFTDFYAPETNQLFMPPDKIIGSSIYDMFSEEEAEKQLSTYHTCLQTGILQTFKYSMVLDSSTRYYEARISKLNDMQILAIIRDETDTHNLDKEISDRMAFQQILMDLTAGFINSPLDKMDEEIQKALRVIGDYTHVDRCYVFDYFVDKGIMKNTYEWCSEGIQPVIDTLQAIPIDAVPEWTSSHFEGKGIFIPSVAKMPEDDPVRQILERQNVKSLLTIPFMHEGKCLGFVGFDSVKSERDWNKSERYLLRLFAEFLTNMKLKDNMYRVLKQNEEQYRLLAGNSSDIIALYDGNFQRQYISPAFKNITGYDVNYLSQHDFFELIHSDDKEQFFNDLKANDEKKIEISTYTYRIHHKSGRIIWIESISNRKYDKDGNLQQIIIISRDVTRRKTDEEKIYQNLYEKDVLIKEIHHRVKNNLNIISSLLKLQARKIKNKDNAISAFKNSSDRVMSMALVHQNLYQDGQFDRIDLKHYAKSLLTQLMGVFHTGTSVKTLLKGESIVLTINTAIPIALILNELITNALKHAFPNNESGDLIIDFHKTKDGDCELLISDTGIGLPAHIDEKSNETLGFNMVDMLVRQISGEWEIIRQYGTKIHIRFPLQ